MLKILDRYLFRELLSPFFLALPLVTFILLMNSLLDLAKLAIKGNVGMMDLGSILFWSLPHLFSLTIPISVLLAANLGLGRLSADNEVIALHASGVGLMRIGRPLLLFAALGTAADAYVMMRLVPRANQKARTQAYDLVKRQLHQGIQQGAFYENYSDYVIYAKHIDDVTGVWSEVMVADVTKPSAPTIIFAKRGRLRFNEAEKFVILELEEGESFVTDRLEPEASSRSEFTKETLLINLENLLKQTVIQPGDREMSLSQLGAEIARRKLAGLKWRMFAVELHKKFAVPVACLAFGVVGLALGARTRGRGKSGGVVISLAIVLVYWLILTTGERMGDQGQIPPWVAMWSANIVVGGFGLTMLVLAAREVDLSIVDRIIRLLTWLPVGSILRVAERDEVPRSARADALEAGLGERRGKTIVIRIPKFNPDFPRILDRYVLMEWIRSFAFIMLAMIAMYVVIDLARITDDITENHITFPMVVEYYEYAIPNIAFLVLGPSCLVTTLLVLGIMSRNNEIISMKASGISSYRIVVPLALIALLVSAVSMVVNDRLLPHMNREAQTRREVILRGAQRSHQMEVGSRWMWGREGRTLYNYGTYLIQENQMQGVMVYELEKERFAVRRIVYADLATWQNPGWLFERKKDPDPRLAERIGAWSRYYDKEEEIPFEPFESKLEPYEEGADYFVAERKAADELTFRELRDYITSLTKRGFSVQHLSVRLYQKLSLPFAPLVMTAVGVPFALRIGRRGSLFGVGVAITLIVVFWACTAAFGPLGETGVLPAHLAAFAPNLIFVIGSVYLLLNLDG